MHRLLKWLLPWYMRNPVVAIPKAGSAPHDDEKVRLTGTSLALKNLRLSTAHFLFADCTSGFIPIVDEVSWKLSDPVAVHTQPAMSVENCGLLSRRHI
jgi:hypothetical protein